MQMKDIIEKKRDGGILNKEEIDFFIKGYTHGEIPDYQVSALLMAIFFKKLNKEETFYLTDAMKKSGDIVDLSDIPGIKVDKHSTGGVGDKTTLIVAPICASAGVIVAKMSGRGLGFTGGTIDKMESIPGMKTSLNKNEFKKSIEDAGMCVIGQSEHIAAADKKLYALRDVTATVDNIGLITSSIMSKKLASGSDAIVLDVKCGNGAFMKTRESAETLSEWMVEIGKRSGKKTVAFITNMKQPLGYGVGNSIEVQEAIETLKCKGPNDITELSVKLSGYMIFLGGKADSYDEGIKIAETNLKNGKALAQFKKFIATQGGNSEIINDYHLFPQAEFKIELKSDKNGYISNISAEIVGKASQLSGAGRTKKEDSIDLSAGIVLKKKIGDYVPRGDVLAVIYSCCEEKGISAANLLKDAYSLSNEKPENERIIYKIIT